MTTKKSWKDYLLSSGMPLEHAIHNLLEDLHTFEPSEFKYVRTNRDGFTETFSVDVHATCMDTKRNIFFDLFVECKYRHDSVKWVFSPCEFSEYFGADPLNMFNIIDCYDFNHEFNRTIIKNFVKTYPVCHRAIELMARDFSNKTIKQAVEQLRYAIISKWVKCFTERLDCSCDKIEYPDYTWNPLFALIPIVVTTAELWRISPYITIEDIKKADNIEKIATEANSLIYFEQSDNIIFNFMQKELEKLDIKEKERFIQSFINNNYDVRMVFNKVRIVPPSLFLIVKYENFKKEMEKLQELCKDQNLLRNPLDDLYNDEFLME